MPRYIDAEHLLSEIEELKKSPWFNRGNGSGNPVEEDEYYVRKEAVECVADVCIKTEPTADVVPVAHGHWYFTEYEYFDCSVCGESYYNGCDTSAEARRRLENGDVFAFCPHCGAKMDESTT